MQPDGNRYIEHETTIFSLNITNLPEIVLINIMEYLTLKDRYYLSVTCQLFKELFNHPTLWKAAHIIICMDEIQWHQRSVTEKTVTHIIDKYSYFFQHLYLEVSGYVQPFNEACLRLFQSLKKDSRLESLTIKVGKVASSKPNAQRFATAHSDYRDLPNVVDLIDKSKHLRRLTIISWPLHIDLGEQNNLFIALLNDKQMLQLEQLSLFYLDIKRDLWAQRIPKLPTVETTLKLVSHFRHLVCLSLRSPMLNDDIIKELASVHRTKLHTLQILIMYSREHKVELISPSAWTMLNSASPILRVEYLVTNRIPFEQLSLMLSPEIPLSSFTVLNYGRCDEQVVEMLYNYYNKTLEKFISLCDSSHCDKALVQLVSSCSKLKHFVYHGEIYCKTIKDLSDIINLSKRRLYCFDFKVKNIAIEEEPINLDETAIAKDARSQEYYLVSMHQWHQDEDNRAKQLELMKIHVSQSFGYKWNI
ncbi:uncharacterized protein LOC131938020 [Physella acuta]|uniref:uncharacterized protein LOC131938020 n=1 Tax=Physella acuta TaxID=109671 RepID=UPI0027DDD4B7|nr:uncharacterized protein LOC131938020 [Physella acuta]XP_059151823.1 uncharacterized protein LOC131938020 [Physella acuta]